MNLLIKSILAGICIAIGAITYLNVGGVAGAILFSLGLLIILNFELKLYTGFIGYCGLAFKNYLRAAIILLGNLIGCCLMWAFPCPSEIIVAKIASPHWLSFIEAIVCGILIYAAVETFKQGKWYMTPFCVAGFILCGAEHSIANACYIIAAREFTFEALIFTLVVVIGNAIGSFLFRNLTISKN
jgi:formate/nitrite transporter FocA (FNT family)